MILCEQLLLSAFPVHAVPGGVGFLWHEWDWFAVSSAQEDFGIHSYTFFLMFSAFLFPVVR